MNHDFERILKEAAASYASPAGEELLREVVRGLTAEAGCCGGLLLGEGGGGNQQKNKQRQKQPQVLRLRRQKAPPSLRMTHPHKGADR